MWRPAKDRYSNRRPYPVMRPNLNIPLNTQRNKQRDAPKQNIPLYDLFSRPSTPPPKPTAHPLAPFLFPPPPTNALPHHYGPDRVDPVPPSRESPARTPRFFRRPPVSPKTPQKDSPQTFPLQDPPSEMPGAFPVPDPAELPDNPTPDPDPQPAKTQAKEEANTNQDEEHRDDDATNIRRLKKSVELEFGDGELDADEEMLLKQLNALHINHNYRINLFEYRQAMKRASHGDKKRARRHARRDAAVEKTIRLEEEEKERERQREEMEHERRRRIHERLQRYREETRRREKEAEAARMKEEAEAWEREQLKRAEELAKQRERERKEREAEERKEAEIRAKEAAEDRRRMQENIRKARELFSADDHNAICREFEMYDAKWAELKTNPQLPPLCFSILPWPVLGSVATSTSDITRQRVQAFVFHPLRGDAETKSRRDRVRAEILKWHPDKFDAKVVGAVIDTEKDQVKEGAGAVARILTQILEEETRKEQRGY